MLVSVIMLPVMSKYVWGALLLVVSVLCRHSYADKAATVPGDFLLGGLFPVHKKGTGGKACGEMQAERGIQRLEAMLYAVDRINKDSELLPNISLGVHILDTCSRETYALDQSLEFVKSTLNNIGVADVRCSDGSQIITARPKSGTIIGVVGGSYSSVSLQVTHLLRLFKIPQISYASTSSALSDKTRFDFFARTVPPDNLQAEALADIVQFFNWTYVNTVSSAGEYGETGIYAFQKKIRARNICMATSVKIQHSATDADFADTIEQLQRKSSARVVVLFLRVDDARRLLLAAKNKNVSNHFIWIASDGWGKQKMPVEGNELVAEGALTIDLQSAPIPNFATYFKRLRPATNTRNPWFMEFWEHVHHCKFSPSNDTSNHSTRCTGREDGIYTAFRQENKVQFVYDAVYAFAQALHNLLQVTCGDLADEANRLPCIENMDIDGEELYRKYILKVKVSGNGGEEVLFNENGDGVGRYNIMNYRRQPNRKYEYVTVGSWAEGLVMDERERIVWPGLVHDTPISICSEPCGLGQIKHVQQDVACCWLCTTCRPWEYVKNEFTCADCGDAAWPTADKTSCITLEEQYMTYSSVYAVVPMCLSLAGTCFTIMVFVTFIRHIDTPIVKASGRELCFMLLSGFLVCYLMTFMVLMKPNPLVCTVQRLGIGSGFALTYASLLVKTNRISRIFSSARKSAQTPAYISPRSQVFFTLALVSVQLLCSAAWLFLEPPAIRHYHPSGQRDVLILRCGYKDKSFLVSLGYVMLLIVTCTVYAVKTRKIPGNFNESKFIGFSMYTTCIIWLAFVPIYFGTLNSFQIQQTTLCMAVSLSAWVALLCLFANKIYTILLHPEKNVCVLRVRSITYSNQDKQDGGLDADES